MPESFSIQTSPVNGEFAKVVFEKQSDRWTHRMEWVTLTQTILIATSIEGTPDCDWPPSQPLQEISQVELDGLSVMLGVGMAGRSHWSLSCSLEPESSEKAGGIFFDVACLVKKAPAGWLGSSYQLGSNVTIGNCGEDWMQLKMDNHSEILIAGRNSQRQHGIRSTQFRISDTQVQIEPAALSTKPTIATRWAFAIEVPKKSPSRD